MDLDHISHMSNKLPHYKSAEDGKTISRKNNLRDYKSIEENSTKENSVKEATTDHCDRIIDVSKLSLSKFRLGSGAYGEVYATNNTRVACKRTSVDDTLGISSEFLREVSSIRALEKSKYVINLLGVSIGKDYLEYYMTRYKYNLSQFMETHKGKLKKDSIKYILFQILHGIYDADSLSISHRDLKPQNILINDDFKVAICDWGISRFMETTDDHSFTTEVQTLWYRCPELLLGKKKYSLLIEIWSAGVIMAELLMGKPLFPGDCEIDQLFQIFQLFGTPNNQTWPGVEQYPYYTKIFPQWSAKSIKDITKSPLVDDLAIDLLQNLLQMDPERRIKLVDALNHNYFDSIRSGSLVVPRNLITNFINFQSNCIKSSYMNKFVDINEKMRSLAIDWLIDIKSYFKCSHRTFFLACYYFDLYLSLLSSQFRRSQLQLLGITCLLLASKINEIYPMSIEDIVYVCNYNYKVKQVEDMEKTIVNLLDNSLYRVTEYTYLNLYRSKYKIDKVTYKRCLCTLYKCLSELKLRNYNGHDLAFGVLYSHLINSDEVSDKIIKLIGIEMDVLSEIFLVLGEIISRPVSDHKAKFYNQIINSKNVETKVIPNKPIF